MNFNKSNIAVTVRRLGVSEAAMLTALMRRAFKDAFAHNTGAQDLKAHIDTNFNVTRQQAELKDPLAVALLAIVDGQPAGYAQMNPSPTPDCVRTQRPVQMQRFYLLKPYWGSNVAHFLMENCLKALSDGTYSAVWLSCWDQNERALSFYRRWGFSKCGSVPFIVGSDRQTDFILLRPLPLDYDEDEAAG